MEEEELIEGKVQEWNKNKGIGKISATDGGRFTVEARNVMPDEKGRVSLSCGEIVLFVPGKENRKHATKVRRADFSSQPFTFVPRPIGVAPVIEPAVIIEPVTEIEQDYPPAPLLQSLGGGRVVCKVVDEKWLLALDSQDGVMISIPTRVRNCIKIGAIVQCHVSFDPKYPSPRAEVIQIVAASETNYKMGNVVRGPGKVERPEEC